MSVPARRLLASRNVATTLTSVGVVARPQLTVIGAQLAAGIGNLAFAVLAARLLAPDGYAQFVTFLALYVLLHVPALALSAAGALTPHRVASIHARARAAGIVAGIVLVVGSVPLGRLLGLDAALVMTLGIAAPGAGLIGVQRGLAFGHERFGRVTGSLMIEPAVRLAVGLVLAQIAGPTGAAVATVIAGYAALTVLTTGPERRDEIPHEPAVRHRTAVAVGCSFVLLAVLQSIDLLLANRVLTSADAAQFALLSTIGGAAFFATATIPLVLMPAATRGRAHASSTAVTIAAGLGLAITAGGALFSRPLIAAGFGSQYADVARLVGPYLLAMALLGVVRVRVACRGASGRPSSLATTVAIGVAVVAEVTGIALWGRSVDAVVATTLFATAGLALVLELPTLARQHAERRAAFDRRSVAAMVGLCLLAAAVRLGTSRGLWVDEAISVSQAQMSFGSMLEDMRSTDVHPPLHHAVLWVTVRLFGTSEAAVRLPSLLAGVALVPAMAWAGRALYDRRTGWVAAVLAVLAPFCVWYSQEARMYSLFMLFAVLAVGAQVQALRRGATRDWILYGVATAAMLWTQYFAILPLLVQQAAFGLVGWQRRRSTAERRDLVRGWVLSTVIIIVAVAPMLPLLSGQLEAYGNRTSSLVPGPAGAGSSTLGGTISIYSVGANLVWAVLGYHADDLMVQIAALWPLLMLLALVLLGRGRSGPSMLLLGLVVVPMVALFAVGSVKRDLFELRYFSGAVPAMLLLGARVVTSTAVRRTALVASGTVAAIVLSVGLVDQQVNGANPRLYDFESALKVIVARAGPEDVVLYEPEYLGDVVDYYAPGVDARPVGSAVPDEADEVWLLATERVVDVEETSARLGTELAKLERERRIVDSFQRPNVKVWELR